MDKTKDKQKISIGILAHVDAGKTTLAEAILFVSGEIRKAGRVDHGDTFLDTHELERKRGITIFSKQAHFSLPHTDVTLIDTPGHADFASEAERTLSVLDYAILVISAVDGVQSHTLTLWSLLKRYGIPVFIFVNKTDISEKSRDKITEDLCAKLDHGCCNFTDISPEDVASCDEALMENYLEKGSLDIGLIKKAIRSRHIFPIRFGSALKQTGIGEFLEDLDSLIQVERGSSEDPLSARVYKITRDKTGQRLTHVKVEAGTLKVRNELNSEKITQIRFYSGEKFDTREEAGPGDICALTGLNDTFAGQHLGAEGPSLSPILSPVMAYRLVLPPGTDVHSTYTKLKVIEEEIPELSLLLLEDTNEIQAQIMGEIQIEILKNLISERLGLQVDFGVGTIIYRETVASVSEGVGHFEPLRHYAEVHLKIEPGDRGTGVQVSSEVSVDELDKNWQRLICTHVLERRHRGVLTGSVLTDVKITVIGGRAHPKHTEGGDFRQATYRAVRHGLMMNRSLLLEPWYDFMLEIPASRLGRAMNDITKMSGSVKTHEITGEKAVIFGRCPVSTMHGYALDVTAYTNGMGKLSVSSGGYDLCHNEEEVISSFNYKPEADLRNTADSVFCAHGSGFVVPWDQVTNYMHVEACLKNGMKSSKEILKPLEAPSKAPGTSREDGFSYSASARLDKDLAEIFNRTYGSKKTEEKPHDLFNPIASPPRTIADRVTVKERVKTEDYLLVDGYNIIFSWDELNELSKTDLHAARQKLTDILCNYQGFRQMTLILVFDAYKVEGGTERAEKYKNIHLIYTKEAETADRYIERTAVSLAKKYRVTVATSDATEQVIIWGAGATRMSARELKEEVERTEKEISDLLVKRNTPAGNALLDSLSPEVAEFIKNYRLKGE
ncbi:MAG: TetM/TetW/TetO/TetS family tetracycline resistance ribosomal protection protein [Lachnospiraceae bacterium]|nr:TetM/TetW/TetO/TetS family tetracycline resistance ribosomal protection protein [Lachnospiraceae bacterium]